MKMEKFSFAVFFFVFGSLFPCKRVSKLPVVLNTRGKQLSSLKKTENRGACHKECPYFKRPMHRKVHSCILSNDSNHFINFVHKDSVLYYIYLFIYFLKYFRIYYTC